MKIIEFNKGILFYLLKDGKCEARDYEYRNFKINVVNTSSEIIFLDEYENYQINISKYDVIDLLQNKSIQIDSYKILIY